jgi:hypothetical protein
MKAPWTVLAWMLLIGVMTTSCQRLEERVPRGPISKEKVAFDNAIAAQYGDLVAVTVEGNNQVLWFVKPDKTIVAVLVNVSSGTISPVALTIPRR